MNRRGMLKSAAGVASAGGLASIAGCSESTQNAISSGGLEITDTESENTAFGNVVVHVMVQNTASSSKSATLVGQVDVEGGDTYTDQRDISVMGEDSNSYELEFDIDFSLSASSYHYSAQLE